MLKGPSFIMLHVADVPQARRFYIETLGFQVAGEAPDFVQFAPNGGAVLALGREDGGVPVELWYVVPDADAAHKGLKTQGVEIVSSPRDEPFGRAFEIRDPSGNTLYVLQPAGEG